jgi:hypothetical protein
MAKLFVAAEDHFALVDLSGPSDDVLPGIHEMSQVARATQQMREHWHFLWDLRELGETVYNDTVDALQGVWEELPHVEQTAAAGPEGGGNLTLLVPPGRAEEVRGAFRAHRPDLVEMLPKRLPRHEVDLEPFIDSVDQVMAHTEIEHAVQEGSLTPEVIVRALAGPPAGWSPFARDLVKQRWLAEAAAENYSWASTDVERMLNLDRALRMGTTHSMLTQLGIHYAGGQIHITPFHSGGVHHAVGSRDDAVLLRPARANRRYWTMFRSQIATLEQILNEPGTKEREIEELLTSNPLFLNSLGYERVYHQIVLPRVGASDLKPDVIAEPAGSEWAEILDLKLPSASLVVGRQDRAAMSAALTEAVAQLREYAAYFDDREAAARIEERHGIRCYQPKMTVIIGRDPTRFSDDELRRALTAHPDLRVVTYDDLMRAARTRLLL